MVADGFVASPQGVRWIDMAKPESQRYFILLGRNFIDNGFSLLRFKE